MGGIRSCALLVVGGWMCVTCLSSDSHAPGHEQARVGDACGHHAELGGFDKVIKRRDLLLETGVFFVLLGVSINCNVRCWRNSGAFSSFLDLSFRALPPQQCHFLRAFARGMGGGWWMVGEQRGRTGQRSPSWSSGGKIDMLACVCGIDRYVWSSV